VKFFAKCGLKAISQPANNFFFSIFWLLIFCGGQRKAFKMQKIVDYNKKEGLKYLDTMGFHVAEWIICVKGFWGLDVGSLMLVFGLLPLSAYFWCCPSSVCYRSFWTQTWCSLSPWLSSDCMVSSAGWIRPASWPCRSWRATWKRCRPLPNTSLLPMTALRVLS